jgi:hypothetical protein
MAKNKDSITMEVVEKFDYLNDKENKVAAVVKWGDNNPTFDIRRCGENKEGELYLAKGISLSYDEAEALYEILKENLKKIKKKLDP